jgi:hypothetical protein
MTQRPLGQEPAAPGPFDQPGPGQPDVQPTQNEATPEQPVVQRAGTPLVEPDETTTRFGDRPYPSGPPTTDTGYSSSEPTSSDTGSTVDTAKGEARQVADTALGSGKEVAETAKEEARNVAAETKEQAASLLATVRTEVTEQAGTQQGRIAEALHSLAKELGSMASSSPESGPLTDLAQQASRKGGELAHWLQEREPSDVLEEVRAYARRRPGTFLVLCGLAGVVAGRLTRSAVATRTELDSKDDAGAGAERAQPAGGYRTTEQGAHYAVAPASEPAVDPYGARSTGVFGGTVESSEPPTATPPAATPYGSAPVVPESGYVGTTRPLDDPSGDPTR